MRRTHRLPRTFPLFLGAALSLPGTAPADLEIRAPRGPQDPATRPSPPVLPKVLEYRKHRGLVLARLDGRPIRLADLAARLRVRYDPTVEERWSRPEGKRELNGPDLPQLLWQFADLYCLEAEARRAGISFDERDRIAEALLEEDFQNRFLKVYAKTTGREASEDSLPDLRRRHRRQQGLAMDVDATLRMLAPSRHTTKEVRDFYFEHGDWFGGKVKTAHILISVRDERTGRLLQGRRLEEARAKLRDVLTSLKPDGSNFGALAARYSDDRATRTKEGLIGWLPRFEDKIPAALLRTAWAMRDGQVSSPIRTFYGWHLVRRIRFIQNHFIIPGPKQMPNIRRALARFERERFLFAMRKRHERILYL